jgi:hypothetical protein
MTYPNECCNDPEQREEKRLGDSVVVSVCKVCGCRHFELAVDPGSLGLRGASL